MKQKLEDDREMLAEVKTYGPREKSKSIVRFQKNGGRLTPDEIFDAVVLDLEATIAADEEEIRAIEKAVSYTHTASPGNTSRTWMTRPSPKSSNASRRPSGATASGWYSG